MSAVAVAFSYQQSTVVVERIERASFTVVVRAPMGMASGDVFAAAKRAAIPPLSIAERCDLATALGMSIPRPT
jgi:hypothetical protein